MPATDLIALIDCNNFFASCEQVFNPSFRNRPLVVLSNNDGCIVARSKEARALKIPMGAPAFKYKSLFLQHNVVVLSSNFPLYADMSHRAIETLKSFDLPVEIYSIDEAFLRLPIEGAQTLGKEIRARVKQWTGLSTSVGIAPTKTLAKVANHVAKKGPCVSIYSPDQLKGLPVDEIWGIGRRTSKKLLSHGILTVDQLTKQSDTWIKKNLSVVGLRTVMELRGTPCLEPVEVAPTRKSILTSRSFKRPITTINDLREAIASFIAIAAKKLRSQNLECHSLLLFAGKETASIHLPLSTASTPTLSAHARKALKTLFKKGESYKRAGILLSELTSKEATQLDLFTPRPKESRLMETLDAINARHGHAILTFASEGTQKRWKTPQKMRSPSYTTSWDDLPKVFP